MIVLGGMGSISGAILGAIVITILPELLRQLPGDLINYRLVIYSALLVVIMLTRPQGVLGAKEFGLSWLKRAQNAVRKVTNLWARKACRSRSSPRRRHLTALKKSKNK